MITKFIKVLAAFGLVFSSWSCGDFVDVVPDNIAVIEDAFETRDNAERFLSTLYGYMPDFASVNNPAITAGDEVFVNDNVARNWPGRIIAQGGQTKVNPRMGKWGGDRFNNLYIALRDCNIFLENIHLPFDLNSLERNRWIAEAKFLKAYYHFYLMRMYGPIPIIKENISVSELEAVRVKRQPVDDVVKYIVELMDEALAEPELPIAITDVGSQLGRITKPIVAAMKARVLVYAASPLFNGNQDYASFKGKDGENLFNPTYDPQKWVVAEEACKAAIDMALENGYDLYEMTNADPNWSDSTVTKLSIRGALSEPWNDEVIWGASFSPVSRGFQGLSQAMINPALTAESRESINPYMSPTINMTEIFYSANGVPIDEDKDYNYSDRFDLSEGDADHRYYIKEGVTTANMNFNREPRFYASLGFDGGIWEGHGMIDDEEALAVEAKRGERGGRQDASRYSLTGYWAKKWVHYEAVQSAPSSGWNAEVYPYPIIRLSDLYLLYAEALNENGKIAEAQGYVDKIRSRAGLDGVVQAWNDHSNFPNRPNAIETLRAIIQQERMIELAFEGHRFWDLRRWKRAEEFLNKPVRAWNIEGEDTDTYYNVISVGNFQFFGRDYLWPISEGDIIANGNLVQNPGW